MAGITKKRGAFLLCACAVLALAVFAAHSYIAGPRVKHRAGLMPEQASLAATRASALQATATVASPSATPTPPRASIDAELGRRIAEEIDDDKFASARWGIYITSLRDGRVLYERDADRPFTPASNMKLYTTAVALDLLGADYRWRTSVYAGSEPDASGTIAGDVTLYGRGAPDLSSRATGEERASLAELADDLYRRGVRRVRGNVIGDESYFRGQELGDGWLWNDVQWYFGAEPSALSINGNEITVSVVPGSKKDVPAEARVLPATDYVHIINDTNTVPRGAGTTIGITRRLSDNEVHIWGDVPIGGKGYSARLSVYRPALWAARLFLEALRARGIAVKGEARSRDGRAGDKFVPENATELASVMSDPLGQVVRATNKESINLNAELILRTLGKERGAMAPEPGQRKMRERDDDQAGLAVIRLWLEQAGVSTNNLALHDGSGLSRLDMVTPEATARLLVRMAQSPSADLFRDSLPVAGQDGTLRFRLKGAETAEHIAAKTGTLTYIHALSGYTTTTDREPLAFSIICNDTLSRVSSTSAIDAIATLITDYPHFPPSEDKRP